MISTTPTTTTTGRITMTVARNQMGITMKILRRLLETNGIEVDMAHRNCAQMTVEQFQEIIEVFLAEESAKLQAARSSVSNLKRISTRNLNLIGTNR